MTAVIKSSRVRVGAPATSASGSGDAPAVRRAPGRAKCTKQVRPLELEGRLYAIEVRCSCGEVTTVELDYAPHTEGEAS
jgi:hypothetical protein